MTANPIFEICTFICSFCRGVATTEDKIGHTPILCSLCGNNLLNPDQLDFCSQECVEEQIVNVDCEICQFFQRCIADNILLKYRATELRTLLEARYTSVQVAACMKIILGAEYMVEYLEEKENTI